MSRTVTVRPDGKVVVTQTIQLVRRAIIRAPGSGRSYQKRVVPAVERWLERYARRADLIPDGPLEVRVDDALVTMMPMVTATAIYRRRPPPGLLPVQGSPGEFVTIRPKVRALHSTQQG